MRISFSGFINKTGDGDVHRQANMDYVPILRGYTCLQSVRSLNPLLEPEEIRCSFQNYVNLNFKNKV